MSNHKHTTAVCITISILTVAFTVLFMMSPSLGMKIVHSQPAYVDKLFSTNQVHTIDIVVEQSDWDKLLKNAIRKEYIPCSVIIDGESVKNVAIRPKGNLSLSSIAVSDSDRYSFKIEFDHYQDGKSFFGLDKLALNNIAQDNTYMKDYLCYQMMNAMGAAAPLSSFAWITVNGADWGLYVAVEGIEEAFAKRVYGNNSCQIYKPDNMNMGGAKKADNNSNSFQQSDRIPGNNGSGNQDFGFPERKFTVPENAPYAPEGNDTVSEGEKSFAQRGRMPGNGPIGSGVTSLIYTDDDPSSYAAIFNQAVFSASKGDQARLISSLKQLNARENIDQVVNVDEVIRYFVVHNFVLNGDSYTGSMVHNYYLSEIDGMLSMIAWDYNLAFGGFGTGTNDFGERNLSSDADRTKTTDRATKLVNYPIDSPLLSGSTEDRPMIAWIFNDEEYLAQYHTVFAEFMEFFDSGQFLDLYDQAISLISPYVQKDPTAFCSYEDFQKGSTALREFCLLRARSISGQLNGIIPSTKEAQAAEGHADFIDASHINIDSIGSNALGFSRNRQVPFANPGENGFEIPPNGFEIPSGDFEIPSDGFETPPGGFEIPFGDFEIPSDDFEMPPGGFERPPDNVELPSVESEKSSRQEKRKRGE